MEENNVLNLRKKDNLLRKFPGKTTNAEQKKVRKVLVLIFCFSLFLVGAAIGTREIPLYLKAEKKTETAISERFQSSEVTPTSIPKIQQNKTIIEEMLNPLRGRYGVFFMDLTSQENFSIRGKGKFTAASLIKLPVLLTLYREAEAGRIDLDKVYRLKAGDKREGSGSLYYKEVGFEISYRKMAQLMGEQSDNTAYNIVKTLLGDEKIQQTINLLGMKNTFFIEGDTTPEDIGLFFNKLYKDKILNEEHTKELLGYLTDSIWEDRIPAGIPKEVKVAHKVGTEVGVISDGGIVFAKKPFILVILTQEADEIEASKQLPQITKKIYEMHINKE